MRFKQVRVFRMTERRAPAWTLAVLPCLGAFLVGLYGYYSSVGRLLLWLMCLCAQ